MAVHPRIVLAGLAALLVVPPAFAKSAAPSQPAAQQAAIDPQADQTLRRMSDYLKGLKSFSFDSASTEQAVTTQGEKIDFETTQQIAVRRPDKLRANRIGPQKEGEFRYDGHQYTVFSKNSGYYATAPAPANLDAAIDDASSRFNIEAPAADLFGADPYGTLMQNATTGRYLGMENLGGVRVHHLAFRGHDVDWQLWVQDGPEPIPRRFQITSKTVKGQPDYAVNITNWRANAQLPDSLFTFTPPPGAQKVPLEPAAPVPTP